MFKQSTRILVVDDMRTMRKIVTKSCQTLGFSDIIQAEDGLQGWQQLEESNPKVELIISDWNMPNCTGIDFLKRVRGDERFKGLPFLLLTAESEGAQVAEAIQAGVDNYILKPFSANNLKDALEKVYKKRA